MTFANLPVVGNVPARPTQWCDEPFEFWGPFATRAAAVRCGLGSGHTNDHVAMFGSDDHPGGPVTVEVRWSPA